jgi:hypothetical protein
MTVDFTSEARTEWLNAISYYNGQRSNLGFEFAIEVDRTLANIVEYPESWPLVGPRTRRSLVRRFPYAVMYYVHRDTILVVSVANLRRKPKEWE